jgi:hypothetical protein
MRHGEAERLCGLEVDHQLKLGWLYHRKVGRLFSLENSAGLNACLTVSVLDTCSVAHQTSGNDTLA